MKLQHTDPKITDWRKYYKPGDLVIHHDTPAITHTVLDVTETRIFITLYGWRDPQYYRPLTATKEYFEDLVATLKAAEAKGPDIAAITLYHTRQSQKLESTKEYHLKIAKDFTNET